MAEITKFTKSKIFANYFGWHCEIFENNKWAKRRVDGDVLNKIMLGVECRLLLKDKSLISVEEAFFVLKLYAKLTGKEKELFETEDGCTALEKENFRKQLLDNEDHEMPYPVVDYLRRQGYHLPIYGLNLFRAKIAINYDK